MYRYVYAFGFGDVHCLSLLILPLRSMRWYTYMEGAWWWRETTVHMFSLPGFFVSFSFCNRSILNSFWVSFSNHFDDFLAQFRFVFTCRYIPDYAVLLQRFLWPCESTLFFSHVTTNDRIFYSLHYLFSCGIQVPSDWFETRMRVFYFLIASQSIALSGI